MSLMEPPRERWRGMKLLGALAVVYAAALAFIAAVAFAVLVVGAALAPAWGSVVNPETYLPGPLGNPCAGACDAEAMRVNAGVPTGVPIRLVIPKGAIRLGSGYAIDGVPKWDPKPRVLSEDAMATGFWFVDEGQAYAWVVMDRCLNPELIWVPSGTVHPDTKPKPRPADLAVSASASASASAFAVAVSTVKHHYAPPTPPVIEPPAVPLPVPGLMLLGALAMLWRRR